MKRALLFLALLGLGCTKKPSPASCDAPDHCVGIKAIVDTGETRVELIADGQGGAYAALHGSGDSQQCVPDLVCHGAIWRLDANGVRWTLDEDTSVEAPFLIDGGVAWRTGTGALHAASDSGHRLWATADIGQSSLAASFVQGDVYAIGDNKLRRLDAATGVEVWSMDFTANNPAAPFALPDAQVLAMGYVGTNLEAKTFALKDGAPGFDVSLLANFSAPAAFFRPLGPILLVSDRLSLRNWDGTEIWGLDGDEGWRFVQQLSDGYAAAGPFGARLTRVRYDGTVLWSTPDPAPVVWLSRSPDGQLIVGRNDGALDKLNVANGLVLWEYGGIAGVKAPTPPLYSSQGNLVFAGANVGADSDTHLTTATLAGQQLERWDAGSRVVSFVLLGNDDVWLATESGKLYLRNGASL